MGLLKDQYLPAASKAVAYLSSNFRSKLDLFPWLKMTQEDTLLQMYGVRHENPFEELTTHHMTTLEERRQKIQEDAEKENMIEEEKETIDDFIFWSYRIN